MTLNAQIGSEVERTVFVGNLHGTTTARNLAQIMSSLFGEVVYCGIDTDKRHYPIGQLVFCLKYVILLSKNLINRFLMRYEDFAKHNTIHNIFLIFSYCFF